MDARLNGQGMSYNVRGFATSMDLKAQRQSLVRPHFALTKPGAMCLGPWMWARPLRDLTSLNSLHVHLTAPRKRKPCC